MEIQNETGQGYGPVNLQTYQLIWRAGSDKYCGTSVEWFIVHADGNLEVYDETQQAILLESNTHSKASDEVIWTIGNAQP